MSLEIGHEIDGYRIVGVLGRGGMGVVYEAEDISLSRQVALKAINPSLTQDELFIKRFQTEARTLAKVHSPFIVSVHALRQTSEGLFIVMEFVDGGTLADRIERGDLSLDESIDIIRQMLGAFEHAHKVNVIHRDIKPANIMLTPAGVVKVTDFGLAKQSQPDMMSTVTQGVMGTLYYMSPEQVRGMGDVDHRSDLYSLGMTIYELLAGKLPFPEGAGEFDIMRSIVDTEFPSPADQNPDCPRDLSELVMKAISKDPGDRFQTATEMLEALDTRGPYVEQTTAPIANDPAASPKLVRAIVAEDENQRPESSPETENRDSVKKLVGGLVLVIVVLVSFIFLPDLISSGPGVPLTGQALSLSTNPSEATVFLNTGSDLTPVGETPLDGVEMTSDGGLASLRIEKAGFISVDTTLNLALAHHLELVAEETTIDNSDPNLDPIQIDPDEQTAEETTGQGTISQPTNGEIVVNLPAPGTIFLDGVEVQSGESVSTGSGLRTITLRHPQFGSFEESISVTAGGQEEFNCYFDGVVNVRATPVWGTVWLNGDATEFTTDTQLQLGPGSYQVEVRKFGYDADLVVGSTESIQIAPRCGDRMSFDFVFSLQQQ